MRWQAPHADRCKFDENDVAEIDSFVSNPAHTTSFYGKEGLLDEYEVELARFFDSRYCILTNSGTSALHSAFFGVGVEQGDEVICPTYTFPSTVTPILQLGGVPVLADVESLTGNLDIQDVSRKLTDRTRAIVVTHMFGHPAAGLALASLAKENGLYLIEDVSISFGSTIDGQLAGTFGDVAAFSLGSTKFLSGGQGGGLVTSDPKIHDRATLLGHFAKRGMQTVIDPHLRRQADTGVGLNYRMHALAVAVSYGRFRRRESLIAQRVARYDRLTQHLDSTGLLSPPYTAQGVDRGTWHGYFARFNSRMASVTRDDFVQMLRDRGLEVTPGGAYPPLHESTLFRESGTELRERFSYPKRPLYSGVEFPGHRAHVDCLVGFPLFLDEDIDLIDYYGDVCRAVADDVRLLAEEPK